MIKDIETRIDRDLEREPHYGKRQCIPLHPDGTLKQHFAKSPAEQRQAIPVVRHAHIVGECTIDGCRCREFDAQDWAKRFEEAIK